MWGWLAQAFGKAASDSIENWAEHHKERKVVKRFTDRLIKDLESNLVAALPKEASQIRRSCRSFRDSDTVKTFIWDIQVVFEDD